VRHVFTVIWVSVLVFTGFFIRGEFTIEDINGPSVFQVGLTSLRSGFVKRLTRFWFLISVGYTEKHMRELYESGLTLLRRF
jgi:hypothetical protein